MIDTNIKQSMLNKTRDDKFLLVLTLPNILKSSNNSGTRSNKTFNMDTLQFSIFGTIAPKIEVPNVEARFGGSTVQISSHARPTYAAIPINFKIDNQFNNYWVIFTWLNVLRDQFEGTYGIVDVNNKYSKNITLRDYSSDMTVLGLNEFNKEVISFTYKSAFPTSISELRYDYQLGEEIICTADFAFRECNVELIS